MITQKFNKKPGHKHLQDVVDEVFGKGAAKVGRAPLNKVTAQLPELPMLKMFEDLTENDDLKKIYM